MEVLCPLCKRAVEKVDHTFIQCQMARLVWFSSLLGIYVPVQTDMNNWMLEWLLCKDLYATQIFCITLWNIWCTRNSVVFNSQVFDPIAVATTAVDYVQEFAQATPMLNNQATRSPQPKWRPPANDWIKINVDAGCFKDGATGWGVIVRNHKGEVLLAASKKENSSMSPTLAEALGIRWSLQLALEQHFLTK